MRSVTYSMGVSLDGYIAGPDGDITAPPPDEEIFRFVTDEIRQVGVHLLGRRLYETMLYWETADQDPSLDDSELEWAAIWKPLPKVVFSTTLPAVQGNARLASGGLAEEIERLRAEPAEGDIAIGGATLAAEAAALGLIDEYRARVYPVLAGGGIPFFPQRERRVDLELVETRTFSSKVVYLRYRVARSPARPPSPGKNGPASGVTSITQPSSHSERPSDLGSSAIFTTRKRRPSRTCQLVARAVAIVDEHHPTIRSQRRCDGRPVVTKRFALHNNVPPSNRANVACYGTSEASASSAMSCRRIGWRDSRPDASDHWPVIVPGKSSKPLGQFSSYRTQSALIHTRC